MLGFIRAEPWENPGMLTRFRCAIQKGYGMEVSERAVFGRPAVFVRQRRACQRESMRALLERGVNKVAFAGVDGCPEAPLREMDRSYLYTHLAGDVGACVAERSGATAVCFFRTVGRTEERAILRLADAYRYLMISAQRDSGAICRALRRRYGLPVIEGPTPGQVLDADFALVFHPPGRDVVFSERCLTFQPRAEPVHPVPGGMPITELSLDVPREVTEELPTGFQPEPILSEAALRGWINPDRIKIKDVSIDKMP